MILSPGWRNAKWKDLIPLFSDGLPEGGSAMGELPFSKEKKKEEGRFNGRNRTGAFRRYRGSQPECGREYKDVCYRGL